MASARSEAEKKLIKRHVSSLAMAMAGFVSALAAAIFWADRMTPFEPGRFVLAVAIIWLVFAAIYARLSFLLRRSRMQLDREEKHSPVPVLWEFRSRQTLLGLPLVHLRISRSNTTRRPVKAWIAGGDIAFGLLFAWGGVAVAPVSFGGLAVGVVSFGGIALAGLAAGGFAAGGGAFGGMAVGWVAAGGTAIAVKGALGGFALASTFAKGGSAHALHVSDQAARIYFAESGFFKAARLAVKHSSWMILLSVVSAVASGWAYRQTNRLKIVGKN
jgi:hypothetical protein